MLARAALALVHVHVTVTTQRGAGTAFQHATFRAILRDECISTHAIGVGILACALVRVCRDARVVQRVVARGAEAKCVYCRGAEAKIYRTSLATGLHTIINS